MRLILRFLSQAFILTMVVVALRSVANADVQPFLNFFSQGGGSEVQKAVVRGKGILPNIMKGDINHAKELGFDDEADAAAATVVNKRPFVVFEVNLKSLQNWNGTDPQGLLEFANQLLFPIVGGTPSRVKSSLTVRYLKKEGEWRVTRWGSKSLITELSTRRDSLDAAFTNLRSFLVQVPALNRNYVGYLDGTQLKFIPLARDRFFPAGVAVPAAQVFNKLSMEAKTVDGSPR